MLEKAWDKINELRARNARHKTKDVRLQELTLDQMLAHAQEELQELRDNPGDAYELADTLAVLLHFAQTQGWSVDFIEDCMLHKLRIRFEEE